MPDEDEVATTPEQRIRLLLKIVDSPNQGAEIAYDSRFRSEEWPRRGYVLQRSDLLAVLEELVALRRDNAILGRRLHAYEWVGGNLGRRVEELEARVREIQQGAGDSRPKGV